MPSHNPECTHGGAHSYSECRDRSGSALKMLEDPISAPAALSTDDPHAKWFAEQSAAPGLTEADREALRAALAGLAPISADLSAHDPNRDPDADADAAQRAE